MKRHSPGLLLALLFSSIIGSADELGEARSAFIRAHAGSPVEWMTWGEEALERVKSEDKPVFLVIGTFSSELGRAMREQSFAHEETAALLNDNFVCILVDRDEHPGLAALNQAWLRTVKQVRGWPLNLWLTPELKPFEGGTYLPPSDEWGAVGFVSLVKQVIAAWESGPDGVRKRAEADVGNVVANEPTTTGGVPEAEDLSRMVEESGADWMAIHNADEGGFGDPPRYPQPELLRFLLRSESDGQKEAALGTLRAMATGGLRDPLDGGFFRYTSDGRWLFPSFQKSASDQARLALAYLDAARVTGESFYGEVARGVLDYALTLHEDGVGSTATEDGVSEELLPGFLWTADEIRAIVGGEEADAFFRAFGVTDEGNLPGDVYPGMDTTGKNLLRGFAESDGFADARKRLLDYRSERMSLRRDSPAGSGTHGLLLKAFARGGNELGEPRFALAARILAALVRNECLGPDGGLRAGPGFESEASARDYVLVLDGLLVHAALVGDESLGELGRSLTARVVARFGDPDAGRFFATTEEGGAGIWARVHLPVPDKSDLPGAEAAFIGAWVGHGLGGDPGIEISPYVSGLVDAMETGFDRPTGDQLFALRNFLDSNRRP